MIYYVSNNGNDNWKGTKDEPFKTINKAAGIAVVGDTIRVFGGTYREWVNPVNGGTSDYNRIVYEAVPGEKPVIKGSEIITGWEKVKDSVWKKTVSNEMFGDWNPYEKEVNGDWLIEPLKEYRVHLGDVYINGVSMFEAKSFDDLYSDEMRITGYQRPLTIEDEPILKPELSLYKWYAEVSDDTTTIYCNFREYDPNNELIEINVRPCCFYPESAGVNYITLRGFEIAQAACPWTPPTSDQIGMIGPHWSKGWIIENNDIHDAKCSAVSLGKEKSTGDNLSTKYARKTGHRYQLESVFLAQRIGWSKDTIGSHIVRNNVIHDCGQNAIVGNLGCVFSRIEHNEIYNIATKHEFYGHEIAGIKFHAAIDTELIGNNIHHCTLGTWLDWEAQGMRVSQNIYHSNDRDFMLEVSHGPTLIDHNLFMSHFSFEYVAQGAALVHNLICGKILHFEERSRNTPYHFPHSTTVAGYSATYGGDDRYYNNIFAGMWADCTERHEQFTKYCDKYTSPEEYKEEISKVRSTSDIAFNSIPQPVWIKDNAYTGYATPSKNEKNAFDAEGFKAEMEEKNGDWYLVLDIPGKLAAAECEAVSTERLGETRLSAMPFEAPDGSAYDFSYDISGESYKGIIPPGPVADLKPGRQSVCVWKK